MKNYERVRTLCMTLILNDVCCIEREKGTNERIYKFDATDRFLQIIAVLQGAVGMSGRVDYYLTFTYFSFISILTWHMTLIIKGNAINRDALHRLALHLFGFIWIGWTIQHFMIAMSWGYEYMGGLMAMMLLTSWIGDGAAFYVGR